MNFEMNSFWIIFPLYPWISFLHVMNHFVCKSFHFYCNKAAKYPKALIQTEMHFCVHITVLKTDYCVRQAHFLLFFLLISQNEHMLGIETHIISKQAAYLLFDD